MTNAGPALVLALALAAAAGGRASAQILDDDLSRMSEAGRAAVQTKEAADYIGGLNDHRRDPIRGCEIAEKAAPVRGDAQLLVGDCYRFGYGGVQSDSRALEAYEEAVKMGYEPARCALASMLLVQGRDHERAKALCPSLAAPK
jgi:TPR repeat protein